MSDKLIGIPSYPLGENSFGVGKAYIEWASTFGNVTMLTLDEPIRENLDLIILPGGPDVAPSRYGRMESTYIGKPCPYREFFDTNILPLYMEKRVPIFGICRGFQSMVVMKGMSLTQHMYHKSNGHNRGERVHELYLLQHNIPQFIRNNMQLHKYSKKNKYEVNSIHHQGLYNKEVDHNAITVWAEHDNFVEAMCMNNYPGIGVQYHPEELMTDDLANVSLLWLLYKRYEKEGTVEEIVNINEVLTNG
jgi:gamma-glutamyl-gamma-aminobutyrate hydrolase PuuD